MRLSYWSIGREKESVWQTWDTIVNTFTIYYVRLYFVALTVILFFFKLSDLFIL